MRAAIITAPRQDRDPGVCPTRQPSPDDVLVKIRACGICGSDSLYISIGGLPPHQSSMPIGHEPAGEVIEVGQNDAGHRRR